MPELRQGQVTVRVRPGVGLVITGHVALAGQEPACPRPHPPMHGMGTECFYRNAWLGEGGGGGDSGLCSVPDAVTLASLCPSWTFIFSLE